MVPLFVEKQVVFETELASAMSGDRFSGLRHTVAGVRVADVVADMSTLEKIKDPTHPPRGCGGLRQSTKR